MRTITTLLIFISLLIASCQTKKKPFNSNKLVELIISTLVKDEINFFEIRKAQGQNDFKLSVFPEFINIKENERLFYTLDEEAQLDLTRFSNYTQFSYDTSFNLKKIEVEDVVLEPYEHRYLETNKIDLTLYKEVLRENNYDVIIMLSVPLALDQNEKDIFYQYATVLWIKNMITVRFKIHKIRNTISVLEMMQMSP